MFRPRTALSIGLLRLNPRNFSGIFIRDIGIGYFSSIVLAEDLSSIKLVVTLLTVIRYDITRKCLSASNVFIIHKSLFFLFLFIYASIEDTWKYKSSLPHTAPFYVHPSIISTSGETRGFFSSTSFFCFFYLRCSMSNVISSLMFILRLFFFFIASCLRVLLLMWNKRVHFCVCIYIHTAYTCLYV